MYQFRRNAKFGVPAKSDPKSTTKKRKSLDGDDLTQKEDDKQTIPFAPALSKVIEDDPESDTEYDHLDFGDPEQVFDYVYQLYQLVFFIIVVFWVRSLYSIYGQH
jgi:hypothetical protein